MLGEKEVLEETLCNVQWGRGSGGAHGSGGALAAVAWGKRGACALRLAAPNATTPLHRDTSELHASVPCSSLPPRLSLARPGRHAAVCAPLWGQPPPSSPGRANFPSDNRSGLPRALRKVGAPLASLKPTENMAPSNIVPWAPNCQSLGPSRSPPARNLSSWGSGKDTRGRRAGSKPCPRSRLRAFPERAVGD